jgi:hypothetical protein
METVQNNFPLYDLWNVLVSTWNKVWHKIVVWKNYVKFEPKMIIYFMKDVCKRL